MGCLDGPSDKMFTPQQYPQKYKMAKNGSKNLSW